MSEKSKKLPVDNKNVDKKPARAVTTAAAHLVLSLEENAYSFLNQSLRHYKKTPRNVREWPFALLHLVQY